MVTHLTLFNTTASSQRTKTHGEAAQLQEGGRELPRVKKELVEARAEVARLEVKKD
jgi:hypothetical protein